MLLRSRGQVAHGHRLGSLHSLFDAWSRCISRRERQERKGNLARLKHGDASIAKAPAPEDRRIEALIEPYLEIRRTSDVAPATLHQDKTALNAYVKKDLGVYAPADLDTKILLGFVDKLKVRLAPSTVRNVIFTLRVFLDVVKASAAPFD